MGTPLCWLGPLWGEVAAPHGSHPWWAPGPPLVCSYWGGLGEGQQATLPRGGPRDEHRRVPRGNTQL